MISGHASLESAIEALRYGAHDYLVKPLEEGRLEAVVKRGFEKVELERELKEARDKLLMHSQKLTAIGQLASGIAHEISRPLSSISGAAELLLKKDKRDSAEEEKLKIIEKEALRCHGILKRLLGFSRLPEIKAGAVDVNKIIDDTLLLLETQAVLKKIEIVKKIDSDIPPIAGIRDQLEQVFLNLIMNAFQSMPGGGSLTIFTGIRTTNDGRRNTERNFVEISFKDTGCGIAEENRKHIFTPFFTTKEKGKGTGLGLAISYGIIQKHNGFIDVESEVGKGTRVTVRLPV
jgi:signal transduction histidine kinase